MKLFAVTVCHMSSDTVAMSLAAFNRTTLNIRPCNHIIVSHHWPLETNYHQNICSIAKMVDGDVIQPEKNLGGHGGVTFALEHIKNEYTPEYDDVILLYDPDSIPAKSGWLEAMLSVMIADPNMAYVSLTHEAIKDNFKGHIPTLIGGQMVITDKLDMVNVTLWRAGFLMSEGLLANSTHYGHIEVPMHEKALKEYRYHGYMADWYELQCPLAHPKEYSEWKRLHASGVVKVNFDEYARELKPHQV